MLVTLLSIFITCCVILLWKISSPFYWKRKGIPYLFPLPLFGSNLPLLCMSLANFYTKLYENFPNEKYFGFHFFFKPTLLIRDPDLIKQICIKDFEYFSSNGMHTNEERDLFGGNLFFLYGQAWRELRLKLSALFTPSKLRTLQDYVETSMVKVNACIEKKIMKNMPVQIDKITVAIVTDVVIQALFGIETDSFEKKSHFLEFGEKIFTSGTNLRILFRLIAPEVFTFLKVHTFREDAINFLRNILKDVIKYRENKVVYKQDFINSMLDMMNTEDREKSKEMYYPDNTKVIEYNLNTVVSNALLLFGGAVESSAMTMTFFLYEATLNQDIQNKCREEIMSVVNETGNDIRQEDISRLTYMNMVLKETLRKYPPFINLTRKCTKTYKIHNTNTTIDAGTLIFIPVRSIQWDPHYFPNPEAFIPERFSDNTTDAGRYFPWGLGPRSCLGQNFAKIEMLLTMSRLLRYYRFQRATRTEVPLRLSPYNIVTAPNHEIWLDVQAINS